MIFLKKVINSVVKTSPPKGDNPLPPAGTRCRSGPWVRTAGVRSFFFFVYLQKMFKFIHPKIMSY